jgi:hypothetical protein
MSRILLISGHFTPHQIPRYLGEGGQVGSRTGLDTAFDDIPCSSQEKKPAFLSVVRNFTDRNAAICK